MTKSAQTTLRGVAALDLAKTLTVVSVDSDNWTTILINLANGEQWILDYPDSEAHAGGSPRIRRWQGPSQ